MESFKLSRSDLLGRHIDSQKGRYVVSTRKQYQIQGLVGQRDIRVEFDNIVERLPSRKSAQNNDLRIKHVVVAEDVVANHYLAEGSDKEKDTLAYIRHFFFEE